MPATISRSRLASATKRTRSATSKELLPVAGAASSRDSPKVAIDWPPTPKTTALDRGVGFHIVPMRQVERDGPYTFSKDPIRGSVRKTLSGEAPFLKGCIHAIECDPRACDVVAAVSLLNVLLHVPTRFTPPSVPRQSERSGSRRTVGTLAGGTSAESVATAINSRWRRPVLLELGSDYATLLPNGYCCHSAFLDS
jgi:hypothetical protein